MAERRNDIRTGDPVEAKVADAILQKPFHVTVGKKTYVVAHPSVATLILASEAIARLKITTAPDPNDVLKSSLAVAPECRVLGDVAAILIIGAKNIDESRDVCHRRTVKRFFGLVKREKVWFEHKLWRDVLAKEILEECSAGELFGLVSSILKKMDVGDFFGLTTFLHEINLLRPTKVAEPTTSATASGR